MTTQQHAWNEWLNSRQDADDLNAIAAALSALIAAADPEGLSAAENALQGEGVTIGYRQTAETLPCGCVGCCEGEHLTIDDASRATCAQCQQAPAVAGSLLCARCRQEARQADAARAR